MCIRDRFFWVEVVGCALCAAVCFTPKLRTDPLVVVASLLAIVGIFCKRAQLLVGGFQIPNLDYAGPMTQYTVTDWATGMTGAYQGMVYWPTPIEFGIVPVSYTHLDVYKRQRSTLYDVSRFVPPSLSALSIRKVSQCRFRPGTDVSRETSVPYRLMNR